MYSSDEEDSPDEFETLDISNDRYYQPIKSLKPQVPNKFDDLQIPQYGSNTIIHSLPAYDLWKPFYPTDRPDEAYRNFHRPKLRHYKKGPQAISYYQRPKAFPIKSLTKSICSNQKKLRTRVIRAIASGMSRDDIINKFLLIRKSKDLTVKNGELFLFEYSEEFPPVLSEIGMASNIKTLVQPKLGPNGTSFIKSPVAKAQLSNNNNNNNVEEISKENHINSQSKDNYQIGVEKVIVDSNGNRQVYFSQLKPGTRFQVIENNLYRAPIFQHQPASCDFLVIRTRNSFYIRSMINLYTVGQTMPLVQIPQPTENVIAKFRTDLSNRYIHKLFMESEADPPNINISLLASFFRPDYRCYLLKRMTHNGCIYDRSTGICYRGNSRYGLQTLKEIRASFTPEQYCVNVAMLAARQRLRDLNYTDTMINPKSAVELETEVRAAPWNTSRAIQSAKMGKFYLDFKSHLIDPTGIQREGFSCVPWSKSPTEDQQLEERKSNQTNNLLPNNIFQSQPTQMKNPLADTIRREKLQRLASYQSEAQLISEVQSKVLSNSNELSSDEEEEELEEENLLDASFDDKLRDLNKLIFEGRTFNELTFEKEEEERRNMIKELCSNNKDDGDKRTTTDSDPINSGAFKNKILKITRTYDSDDGPIERTEIVREPKIIAMYIKQKSSENGGSQRNSQTLTNGATNIISDRLNQTSGTCCATNGRRSSDSLSPTELCRADGMVLTINKSVLDIRGMRYKKRRMRIDDSS